MSCICIFRFIYIWSWPLFSMLLLFSESLTVRMDMMAFVSLVFVYMEFESIEIP